MPARTKNYAARNFSVPALLIGITVFVFAEHARSQSAPQPVPLPAPQSSDAQEQRRVQERERVLRGQQERGQDVRLPSAVEVEADKLPRAESPCFTIHQLTLKSAASDKNTSAYPFAWSLDAAAGPDQSDSPLERCLGAEGVGLVIKRVQNAVIAGGYVNINLTGDLTNTGTIAGRSVVRLTADNVNLLHLHPPSCAWGFPASQQPCTRRQKRY